LWLASRARERIRQSAVLFSILMSAAVLYCSWIYVDDLSFFRILFRLHMGWWYPVFLCAAVAGLYHDFGSRARKQDQSDSPTQTTDS
jgi:hypothetical protein